jgi:hypothetical protein
LTPFCGVRPGHHDDQHQADGNGPRDRGPSRDERRNEAGGHEKRAKVDRSAESATD